MFCRATQECIREERAECEGWDSNPRRPSPEDLKSRIDYWKVKNDFLLWLRNRGLDWDNYAKQLIRHLEKFSKPINRPMDIVSMFGSLNNSQKRHLTNGLRNLFNFYQSQGLESKPCLDILRENLPRTFIGVDLNIPSETEIIDSLRVLQKRDSGKRILALYNLLLDSGLRLIEGVRLYNSLVTDSSESERQNGFHVVALGYFRNTKLAYFGFLTDYTMELLKDCEKPLTYKKIMGSATRRFNVVSYKYLRKFVFDMMTSEQLNIPESVADFIEGRTAKVLELDTT